MKTSPLSVGLIFLAGLAQAGGVQPHPQALLMARAVNGLPGGFSSPVLNALKKPGVAEVQFNGLAKTLEDFATFEQIEGLVERVQKQDPAAVQELGRILENTAAQAQAAYRSKAESVQRRLESLPEDPGKRASLLDEAEVLVEEGGPFVEDGQVAGVASSLVGAARRAMEPQKELVLMPVRETQEDIERDFAAFQRAMFDPAGRLEGSYEWESVIKEVQARIEKAGGLAKFREKRASERALSLLEKEVRRIVRQLTPGLARLPMTDTLTPLQKAALQSLRRQVSPKAAAEALGRLGVRVDPEDGAIQAWSARLTKGIDSAMEKNERRERVPEKVAASGRFLADGPLDSYQAKTGRVARPFGFALTDPSMRLSRTRLFPWVTQVISR